MHMKGFTLIEVLVVVVIISLLLTLVGPHIISGGLEAQRHIALAKCSQYHGQVSYWMMQARAAAPPRSLEDLEIPLREGERNYLRLEADPWGTVYRIELEGGRRFRIYSNGQDGLEGTIDDLCFEPTDENER
jgi:prepilin-type N-terminal cleavage/methylation domain-containing protein